MMRKKLTKFINYILVISVTAAAVRSGASYVLTAEATTIGQLEEDIRQRENEINQKEQEISNLEEEQDILLEQMDDLNAEIINTLASIGMKEDEIADKEIEIQDKQHQIELTSQEYDVAKAKEEKQRLDMAARTRLLYEQGDTTIMGAILDGQGLADILNKMDYVEKIYEYSKMKLDEYIETKDQIQALWDQLEQEEAELEQDRAQLKVDEEELQAQKDDLDVMLAQLRKQSANYDAALSKARQEAAAAKKLLQQDQQKLKQLQAQQKAAEAAAKAANGTYTTDYNSIIDGESGSELGKQIARFACQYVGNPYVNGGTSLTNGADCSGFTYSVYMNFGYSLPRTSTQQQSKGTGVSYSEAEPGDLVFYSGHVAIYIGQGKVVHASNSQPYPSGGIKVSNAQYRPILAVRRIV